MPYYDYKCPQCGMLNEFKHAMDETPLVQCAVCVKIGKNISMKKVVSKPNGIHFKGSGWYETDYKGK